MPRRCVHVLYDARCNLCVAARRVLELLGASNGFRFIDIHDPAAMEQFPRVDPAAARGQMHLVDEAGRVFGGYDAVVQMLARLPPLAPLHALLRTRPMRRIGPRVYGWIARHRYRLFGRRACSTACPPR